MLCGLLIKGRILLFFSIVGVCIAFILPIILPPIGEIVGNNIATGESASILSTLRVEDGQKSKKLYDRESFAYQKVDLDGNGCLIRDDILARDLTDVVYQEKVPCAVREGVLKDPYTGKTIVFKKGKNTSKKVQIDHVVALRNAWDSGADRWDKNKRVQFGNDPLNLLAVEGKANEDKSDKSADYWLPSNKEFRCEYVARQIKIKEKYDLTVTSSEKRAMQKVLHSCPLQK